LSQCCCCCCAWFVCCFSRFACQWIDCLSSIICLMAFSSVPQDAAGFFVPYFWSYCLISTILLVCGLYSVS
jgi:phosphoglycerol transferase MdoB-like AlkP superfamily enzyme